MTDILDQAGIDSSKLIQVLADMVRLGELHIVTFNPPDTDEGVLQIELMASSATAWPEVRARLLKRKIYNRRR